MIIKRKTGGYGYACERICIESQKDMSQALNRYLLPCETCPFSSRKSGWDFILTILCRVTGLLQINPDMFCFFLVRFLFSMILYCFIWRYC